MGQYRAVEEGGTGPHADRVDKVWGVLRVGEDELGEDKASLNVDSFVAAVDARFLLVVQDDEDSCSPEGEYSQISHCPPLKR